MTTSYDLLQQAQEALTREGQDRFEHADWRLGHALETAYDVVDHVRRVTGHYNDHHYASEKARVMFRSAGLLWFDVVTRHWSDAKTDELRGRLDGALGELFDFVLDVNEGRLKATR